MTSIFLLVIGLLVSIACAFTDRVRGFGIGGLVFIVVVSGVVWAGHIPLA